MSKKKKKKPSPQRNQQRSQHSVRISQCMIVKNEEKNIERALEWAKDIAFEQIVVDTGSTDRTVELAEKMGAKVYHFEWIDDFSAAKNFAMDKAKGDWIAILDADEYMSQKDAKELYTILKKIEADPVASRECEAITCTFVNLDDNGNVISVISHQRVFQNRPYLRFEGRIHEVIKLQKNHFQAPNLRIMHTGYTQATYSDTNKYGRNVMMLRNELESDPDNPDIMFYLADSLKTAGTKEAVDESEELFHKALRSERPANIFLKQLAYNYLIPKYSGDDTKKEEAMRLCNDAVASLPDLIDYYYYRAVLNNQKGNYKAAQDDLTVCENALLSTVKVPTTQVLMPSPILLFHQLRISAEGLSDEEGIMRNTTIIRAMLIDGKGETGITGSYIRAMSWHGAADDEILGELGCIYDLSDPKDILFIARAAKEGGAVEFTRNLMTITKEMFGEESS